METVLLSFGANMANRRDNIRAALGLLEAAGLRIIKTSSFYQTSPVGFVDQGNFINSAAIAEAPLEPLELLKAIKKIEQNMGRDRDGQRWGPRPVDIDIVFFGLREINEKDLTIPHPLFAERMFVLLPMVEIAPDYIMPGGGALIDFFNRRVAEFDFSLQKVEKLAY